jgi:hypothetical protein
VGVLNRLRSPCVISAKNENMARPGALDPSILPLLLGSGISGKEVRQYQTDYDHPDEITSRGEVAHHQTALRCEKKHGKDNAR